MRWSGVLVIPMLVATACGGGGASPSSGGPARAPGIPAQVAASLAGRADDVASDLASGNGCAAQRTAAKLRSDLDRAVSAGEVPVRLRPALRSAVASLESRIVCTPPAPPAPKPRPHRHHEKHHGHGEGD